MIIKSAVLETVCGIKSKLPRHELPEFAFTGRSNVGKSTLINSLMNRKALARASSTPGKTQTINFYLVNGQFYLVDLPGYGYTKANVASRREWGRMVDNYLNDPGRLAAIFLLLDIRHDPGENDRQMYDWIVAGGHSPIIIATKADKIKRSQLGLRQQAIRKTLALSGEVSVIPYAAPSHLGRETVHRLLTAEFSRE